MATPRKVEVRCDTPPCPQPDSGARTFRFTWCGRDLQLDLCDAHRAEFRAHLAWLHSHGRLIRAGREPRRRDTAYRARCARVRLWARATGHECSDRGAIPRWLWREYVKAGQQ